MSENRKIALACFIGGALCTLVALLVTHTFWWVGIPVGGLAGYLCYDLRTVIRSIPVAAYAAGAGTVKVSSILLIASRIWLLRPHPFLYAGMFLTAIPCIWFTEFLGLRLVHALGEGHLTFSLAIVLGIEVFLATALFVAAWLRVLAFVGSRVGERCFWRPFWLDAENKQECAATSLMARGYREKSLSYPNAARWMIRGVYICAKFFAWPLWKYLAIGFWKALCLPFRFVWILFKLVHSHKRLLCGIDGAIGGATSYLLFAAEMTTLAEQLMVVFAGGIIGAGLGILNWELVSKRWLKLHITQ